MRSAFYWLGTLLVVVLIASVRVGRTPISESAPLVQAVQERVSESACANCHADIVESWRTAPHSFTLRPPADDWMARFVGRQLSAGGATYRFHSRDGRLWFESSQRDSPVAVDWIFGSGHHELTPVVMVSGTDGETELIQLHVSWFAGDRLGVTPGSLAVIAGSTSFGIHHQAHETRECFGCHASYVPLVGQRIDLKELQTGVTCQRCHQQAASHARADGVARTNPDWPRLSPRESINRCGECHRRSDQFTPDELRPDNTMLIRFAPVGIALSPCFRANDDPRYAGRLPRFDCLTCHDPHQPASKDPHYYVARCIECHGADRQAAVNCSVEPDGERCLDCHMPNVEVRDQLSLTDHWIRVRKEGP